MKKNYWLAGLFALGMMTLQGCDEIGNGIGSGNGEGGNTGEPELGGKMEELAPNAQKTRLQEVGLEFVNSIKAGDHENLVDVAAYLDENLDFEIDTAYVGKLERLYEETYEGDNDYYYSSPVAAVRSLMAVSLDAAQSGAQLPAQTSNVWTTTLKAGMPDVYGRFTPNMENEEWEWDSSVNDRLEVAFTDDHNQNWVATLKGSKETTRAKLTIRYKWTSENKYVDGPDAGTTSVTNNDDYYEFMVDVPKEITFTVKCNNNSVIDLTLNSSMAIEANFNEDGESTYQNYWYEWSNGYWDWVYDESTGEYVEKWIDVTDGYYYWGDSEHNYVYTLDVDYTNLNADAKLKVNAYEETFKTEVTKQGMAASASVKINGKDMLKSGTTLKADMDKIIEKCQDAANEEKDLDEIDAANTVQELSFFVDVMGKVQIVGKCDKFEDLFDALVDLEEADDEEDFDKYERNMKQVNEAYSVTIHYDNTETVQAKIEAEAYLRESEWDSYTYCEARPVIVFAVDDSRYSFEDYFTESSFGDLIEAVEDLEDDFEKMFDRYFDGEEPVEMNPNYGGY